MPCGQVTHTTFRSAIFSAIFTALAPVTDATTTESALDEAALEISTTSLVFAGPDVSKTFVFFDLLDFCYSMLVNSFLRYCGYGIKMLP
jgi:hypothetical protein